VPVRRVLIALPTQRLENDGTLMNIEKAIHNGLTEYSVADLSIPGLRHFIYKSRAHIQITSPSYEEPYDDIKERRRSGFRFWPPFSFLKLVLG
jgi:hypothetical protein